MPARRWLATIFTGAPGNRRKRAARRSKPARSFRCTWHRRQATAYRGKLISAVWDPWATLHEHARDLDRHRRLHAAADCAEDRGMTWGIADPARRHRRLRRRGPEARGGAGDRAAGRMRRRGGTARTRAGGTVPGARSMSDWRAAVEAPDVGSSSSRPQRSARARCGSGDRGRKARARREAGRTHRGRARPPDRRRRSRPVARTSRLQSPLPPGAAAKARENCATAARSASDVRARTVRPWRACRVRARVARRPARSGGGELIDQGVHLIDLARWFLGDFTDSGGFDAYVLLADAGRRQRVHAARNRARPGRMAARQLHRMEEPVLARNLRPQRQAARRRARRQLRRRAADVLQDAARRWGRPRRPSGNTRRR